MLTLAYGQTDLWACFYHEIRDKTLLNQYRALLSVGEAQKELRFVFARDQQCYIVTRALLRTVLSRYAALDPAQWLFALNAYGKPEIANPYGGRQSINFNLSHTDGLIVLGVSAGTAFGIDTENLHTRQAPIDIADSFFAVDEAAALHRLAVDEQEQRFFSYWTLKEAYIKARGMGLSIPLDRFSFHFSANRKIHISFQPPLEDDPDRWRFQQFSPSSDHLVSLCTERNVAVEPTPDIAIRKIVPLQKEKMMTFPVLRDSL
jgi:4'-phosphopantetheinyl transferase